MITLPKSNNIQSIAIGLLFLGASLRFWGFWSWSLTNDEFSALSRIRFSSFGELISKGVMIDGHPAFTQVFLYYWTKLAGTSVFAIRLPFVAAGIASLIYFYKLSSKWLSQSASLIALCIFSVSHLFVLYSQLARPYSFGLFFILGFSYHWYKIISRNYSKTDLGFFVIFGLLSMLTHYFSGLMYFILIVYGFFKIDNKLKLLFTGLTLLSGLLFLPHLSITLNHFTMGGVSWLPEPEGAYIFIFIKFIFNNSRVFLYIAFLIPLLAFLKNGFSFINGKTIALSLLFLIPYLIAYFYSIHISPLMQFSVLIFFAPFLIMGLASMIKENVRFRYVQLMLILLTLTGLFSLIFQLGFFKQKRFANFKEVAELSIQWEQEFGKQNMVSLANFSNENYIHYYTEQLQPSFRYDVPLFDSIAKQASAQQLIGENNPEYVLVAFANVPVPKATHEYIKTQYPVIVKQERFFNSEVVLYGKGTNVREKLFSTNYSQANYNQKWSANQLFFQDSIFISDSMAYFISPESEYALTYRDSLKNVFPENHNELTVSAKLKSEALKGLKLVTSIERDGDVMMWEAIDCKFFHIPDKWYEINVVISKKSTMLPSDRLIVYFWNPDQDSAYIDEFEISNYADSNYEYYEY